MKYTALTVFAVLLIVSCSEENNKQKPSTTQATPARAEDFDSFFEQFSADSVFQVSRIKFPLTSEVYDIDAGKNITSTTSAGKWEFFNIKQLKKDRKYIFNTRKEKEQYIVNVQMEDTGVYVDYIFERRNNKWILIKIADQST